MNIISNTLFVSSIFSFIFSCRHIPDEEKMDNNDISSNIPISIKINFLGVEYEKNNPDNILISENNTKGGILLKSIT